MAPVTAIAEPVIQQTLLEYKLLGVFCLVLMGVVAYLAKAYNEVRKEQLADLRRALDMAEEGNRTLERFDRRHEGRRRNHGDPDAGEDQS